MNSINNGWDSTKRAEIPYFHCGHPSQNENEKKGYTRKKNMIMDKSKENALIYIHTYIYTH